LTPDSLQELEELARHLPEAVQAGRAREIVSRAVQQVEGLSSAIAKLETWGATARVYREAVVPMTDTFRTRGRSVRRQASELSAVKTVVEVGAVAGDWDVIRSSIEELLREGSAHWEAVVGQLQWCQTLGTALEQVSATRSVGSKLKNVFAKASALRPFPPAVSACDQLQTLRRDADLHKADLKQLNVGKSVEAFLVALANRSALVAHIDAEVLAWVDKHQLATQLHVELRGL
jgi:hypothetical protein